MCFQVKFREFLQSVHCRPRNFTRNFELGFYEIEARVQVVGRQKLYCNRENIEVYRVKYDVFLIRIEFLTTNNLDPAKEAKRKEAQRYMFTNNFIGRASHVIHGTASVSKTLKQAKAN